MPPPTQDEQEVSHQALRNHADRPAYVSTRRLEAAVNAFSKHAGEHEYQLKDLELRLSENSSNFRAIDSLLQESYTGVQRNSRRADRALKVQVPLINEELDESVEIISELAETLPNINSQVADIRLVYDSGRTEAVNLIAELSWLNTEFYERWRSIIFTSKSPVSWRWKAIMRALFAISFIICVYLFWIGLKGAYRAHRHRLVWGEKLMS